MSGAIPDATPVPDNAVFLCRQDTIVEGRARGFDVHDEGSDRLFVVRHQGGLHAWRNACPHNGTPMAWQRDEYLDASGTLVMCHTHGAQFKPDTGLCVRGPCLGKMLTRETVTIDAAGDVYWLNKQ